MRVHDVVVDDREVGGRRDRAGARDDGDASGAGASAAASRSQLSLSDGGADRRRPGRRRPASSAASAWTVLPRPCSSARNVAPRAQHVVDAGALERAQLAAERGLDRRAPGASWARERRTSSIAASCSARSRSSTSLAFGGDLDAVGAQVVLERLDEVRVDRQRAAVRLAGGQREEGRDRVGIPVDVEREARLADALDQRERRAARAPGRPAGASRSAARACRAARRAAPAARRRSPAENGSQSRPPRSSASAASSSGSSPEIVSSTNAPRPLEPRRADAADPAARRLRQPARSRPAATSSAGKRSITPFTYGAVESACGAHHSFASQSKRRPGIARTASTMSARYGKAKTTCSWPWRSARSSTL